MNRTPVEVEMMIHQREYYVSNIFDKKRLAERWKLINYTKPKKLNIFQTKLL